MQEDSNEDETAQVAPAVGSRMGLLALELQLSGNPLKEIAAAFPEHDRQLAFMGALENALEAADKPEMLSDFLHDAEIKFVDSGQLASLAGQATTAFIDTKNEHRVLYIDRTADLSSMQAAIVNALVSSRSTK